jgi:hypothetical protein
MLAYGVERHFLQSVPISTKVVSSNLVHVLDATLCEKVCQ